jgi:tyrosinase
MAFTRRNVWELGGDWADPILWYARGIKALKVRPLADPTSWRFYGGIHGIDAQLWRQLGYLGPNEPAPSRADITAYWNQCQHGSWYFLPWHRGYLLGIEAVVRDAVVKLGGPADWALPYWNYFKPNESALPPAFASPNWPDGNGDNPLFVPQRYGPNNDGNVFVPTDQINLAALGDTEFTGAADGGSAGFGGVDTGFSHGGNVHGDLESQPHDIVHVLVGGGDPNTNLPGLMSDPDTAGLDPIFYLHHGNIDRLWEVWRENPTTNVDPTETNWLNGPPAVGQRAFMMPMPGGVRFTYTPGQMSNLSQLNYVYDDVSPPGAAPQAVARLRALGMPMAAATTHVRSTTMAGPRSTELIGAGGQNLRVAGTEAKASVALDGAVRRKVASSLAAVATTAQPKPDRVFLNLENVRGLNDATAFKVYINVPEGEDPAKYPSHLAGSVALFGVRKATMADQQHAGNGVTFVLEITQVIDALHLAGKLDANQLGVRLVPTRPVPEAAQVSIGRISIYRQGA